MMVDGDREPRSMPAWRWLPVVVGVFLLVGAGTLGFAPMPHPTNPDSICGALFTSAVGGNACEGTLRGVAVGIVAAAVVGASLVLFGLAGRLRGARLVLASALIIGIWVAGVVGTTRLLHYDRCGSVTTPSEWSATYSPNGESAPDGCPGVLNTRRSQAVALWILAAAMAGWLAVLATRSPDRSDPERTPSRQG